MTPQMWAQALGAAFMLFAASITGFVCWQQWKMLRKRRESQQPLRDAIFDGPKRRRRGETHAVKMGEGRAHIVVADMPPGKIVLSGWHIQAWRWKVDDFLELFLDQGRNTRYQIDKLRVDTASSLYIAECSFAPRGAAANGS